MSASQRRLRVTWQVATNLLYIEAMQEIKSKNYVIEKDSMKQELKEAREAGDKQKFVQICGAIPFHNFWTWKGKVYATEMLQSCSLSWRASV